MGEMADMAIDEFMDFEESRDDYRMGLMSRAEAYDAGIIDELGYELGTAPALKTCRCCKQGGLHWGTHQGKWRLFDFSGIHKCPAVPLESHESKEPTGRVK